MNIDEQTRHPKKEWYKKLTIHRKGRQWKIQLYCGIQNSEKEDLNWREKKQQWKIQISDKRQKA